jgi:hypothetical protein
MSKGHCSARAQVQGPEGCRGACDMKVKAREFLFFCATFLALIYAKNKEA